MQTLRVNNWGTLRIKITKFSGYYFYTNTQQNISGLYIWQYVRRSVQSGEAFSVDGNNHTHSHIQTRAHKEIFKSALVYL